jgi:glycosyltransferase involved in cell wall biosynthesis
MRNFGPLRSPYYGVLQCRGEAVIALASDLQDPPELIPQFVKKWEEGAELVLGVKIESEENKILYLIRTVYYKLHNMMSEVKVVQHSTGFGLYDKRIVQELRKLHEYYPYLRGLIIDLGFRAVEIPYKQAARKKGRSSINLYRMYDVAMVGLTCYSLVPLRLATLLGLGLSVVSFLMSIFYLVYKLLYWHSFPFGIAPLLIGMFGLFSLQMAFVGLVGEYVAATRRDLVYRPLVLERERINFED